MIGKSLRIFGKLNLASSGYEYVSLGVNFQPRLVIIKFFDPKLKK